MIGKQGPLAQAISIFTMGASIGWLSGLSVSPVIGSVLSSIVGIGAGIVTGLRVIGRGKQSTPSEGKHIDARPAALFMLAIAITAPLGIMARTFDVFGSLQAQHALEATASQNEQQNEIQKGRQYTAGLFWSGGDRCDELITTQNDEAFRYTLRASGVEGRALEEAISDVATLRKVIRVLCFPGTLKRSK